MNDYLLNVNNYVIYIFRNINCSVNVKLFFLLTDVVSETVAETIFLKVVVYFLILEFIFISTVIHSLFMIFNIDDHYITTLVSVEFSETERDL